MFYLVETHILIDNLIAYLVNSLHMVLKKVSFTFNMNEFLSVYIANHSPNYEIFCQIECKWIKTVNVCKRLSRKCLYLIIVSICTSWIYS